MYKWSSTKLSAIELAEILRVSQSTIRTWAARGDIPMHSYPAIATDYSNEAT
jgi:DNA-binding transcriptional regulator YiaG